MCLDTSLGPFLSIFLKLHKENIFSSHREEGRGGNFYNENGEWRQLEAMRGLSWSHVAGAERGQLVQQGNFYYHFLSFITLSGGLCASISTVHLCTSHCSFSFWKSQWLYVSGRPTESVLWLHHHVFLSLILLAHVFTIGLKYLSQYTKRILSNARERQLPRVELGRTFWILAC